MTDEDAKLKDRLASAYRVLLGLGLFDFAGDASVRIPGTDTFLIRHTRVDVDKVPTGEWSLINTSADNIIKMDLDGNQLEGEQIPPWEVFTHTAIYRARSDVGGVVHAHPMMVTAFSMVGRAIEPVYLRGVESTGDGIPIFDKPDPITSKELAAELVGVLGGSRACMMRSHGLVTVGSTLEGACVAAINLEEAALMEWTACALGVPRPLPRRSIELRQKLWEKPTQVELVFRYYEQALAGPPEAARLRAAKNLLRGKALA